MKGNRKITMTAIGIGAIVLAGLAGPSLHVDATMLNAVINGIVLVVGAGIGGNAAEHFASRDKAPPA